MLTKVKLAAYAKAKAELSRLKALEMDLRIEIVDALASELPIGTHKLAAAGIPIKIVKKNNSKIDKDLLDAHLSVLTEEERECIKWTPTIIAKEYKACDTPNLDGCIITTPAAPTVEIDQDALAEAMA